MTHTSCLLHFCHALILHYCYLYEAGCVQIKVMEDFLPLILEIIISNALSLSVFCLHLPLLSPFFSLFSLSLFFSSLLSISDRYYHFKDERLTEEEKEYIKQSNQMRGVAVAMWALAGTAYYDLALERDKHEEAKKGKEKGTRKGVTDDELSSSSSSYLYESASACYQKALRWGVWGALPPVAGRTPPRRPELGSECRVLLW